MPKELHDKVNELLKNDSFYPEKSKKEREDLAWPIATNILKESSFNFKNYHFQQVLIKLIYLLLSWLLLKDLK